MAYDWTILVRQQWEKKGFKNLVFQNYEWGSVVEMDFPEDTGTLKKMSVEYESRGFITNINFFDGEKWI